MVKFHSRIGQFRKSLPAGLAKTPAIILWWKTLLYTKLAWIFLICLQIRISDFCIQCHGLIVAIIIAIANWYQHVCQILHVSGLDPAMSVLLTLCTM